MTAWLSGLFRKVVCGVTDAEFDAAKSCADYVVITESALGGAEVALAFRPREQWPAAFRSLRLYGQRGFAGDDTGVLGRPVFRAVKGDITKLAVDAIVERELLTARRRGCGRRHPPSCWARPRARVPTARRLRHRRREDYLRIPPAGAPCHPHRRPGVARRAARRGRSAGLVLPTRRRTGAGPRGWDAGFSRHQHRHLRVSGKGGGADCSEDRSRRSCGPRRGDLLLLLAGGSGGLRTSAFRRARMRRRPAHPAFT